MNTIKRLYSRALPLVLIIGLTLLWPVLGLAQSYALGDIPLDPETYARYERSFPDQAADSLPSSYDARNYGLVTPAKNQGNCGSCWAFAATGAFESHLLKQYGGSASDLSEQQQVSCNTGQSGCCGGSANSIKFWETQGPIYESCGPYKESSTSCPTKSTEPCSNMNSCSQLSARVTGFYTVTPTVDQMKTSLYNDGPSYWRYDVYNDFYTFWNSASAGTVYKNSGSTFSGGHAVLLIGWDDAKQAFLCKNSWGSNGGPQKDGTFWIAYSGHTKNLNIGMANFKLTGGGTHPSLSSLYDASVYQAYANFYNKLSLLYGSSTYRYYAYIYQMYAYQYLYSAYSKAPSGSSSRNYAYYAYYYGYYAYVYAYYSYVYGSTAYAQSMAYYAYQSRIYAANAQYYAALNM